MTTSPTPVTSASPSNSASHTVEKIGGTSMAATEALFGNVLIGDRRGSDLYNRIFVVSAYAGMTDLLLEHKKSGAAGVYAHFAQDAQDDAASGWQDALEDVRGAMKARNADLFDRDVARGEADAFVDTRIDALFACLDDLDRLRAHGHFCLEDQFITVREMLAGMGEAHSAHSTALLLRERGVNAVFVDLTVWNHEDLTSLDARIEQAFAEIDLTRQLPIVTGYAGCEGGMVRRYARGYSEMTFSRIAVVTGASEAIIHKEFHLSSADPRVVGEDRARKIGATNYHVADQLANLGMEAIHPRAGRGLRQSDIDLRVRNTFDRHDGGTVIRAGHVSSHPRVEIVTGLSNSYALQVFEQDMVGEKGYDAAILEVLTRHRAWIVSKTSNANTITHYLSNLGPETMERIVSDLEREWPGATISSQPVALVSAIGSDLSEQGLIPRALTALAQADVEVFALQHQIRNVDVQFVIEPAAFDDAVRTLHAALVEIPDTEDLADGPTREALAA